MPMLQVQDETIRNAPHPKLVKKKSKNAMNISMDDAAAANGNASSRPPADRFKLRENPQIAATTSNRMKKAKKRAEASIRKMCKKRTKVPRTETERSSTDLVKAPKLVHLPSNSICSFVSKKLANGDKTYAAKLRRRLVKNDGRLWCGLQEVHIPRKKLQRLIGVLDSVIESDEWNCDRNAKLIGRAMVKAIAKSKPS